MLIYLVGCLLATEEFRAEFEGQDHLWWTLILTFVASVGSWMSVVAMITNKAYERDKKDWNV